MTSLIDSTGTKQQKWYKTKSRARTSAEEKVSFALEFFFLLGTISPSGDTHNYPLTLPSNRSMKQCFHKDWHNCATKWKKVGHRLSEATSPDTIVTSEIQSLSLQKRTYHETSVEEIVGAGEESKFSSANSLIDSLSVLLLRCNFVLPLKKEHTHTVVDTYWYKDVLCFPTMLYVPISSHIHFT